MLHREGLWRQYRPLSGVFEVLDLLVLKHRTTHFETFSRYCGKLLLLRLETLAMISPCSARHRPREAQMARRVSNANSIVEAKLALCVSDRQDPPGGGARKRTSVVDDWP